MIVNYRKAHNALRLVKKRAKFTTPVTLSFSAANPSDPFMAIVYMGIFSPIILLGADNLVSPRHELEAVIAHELAHVMLGHLSLNPSLMELPHRRQLELDADKLALAFASAEGMYDRIIRMEPLFPDPPEKVRTHPTWAERKKLILDFVMGL